jgi:hypothetical protein
MFNRSQVKVIELFHPGYVVYSIREITAAVGGKWCAVTGKMPDKYIESEIVANPRKYATASVTIDVESVKMALDYSEVEKKIKH